VGRSSLYADIGIEAGLGLTVLSGQRDRRRPLPPAENAAALDGLDGVLLVERLDGRPLDALGREPPGCFVPFDLRPDWDRPRCEEFGRSRSRAA
jgi:hypothetical protein